MLLLLFCIRCAFAYVILRHNLGITNIYEGYLGLPDCDLSLTLCISGISSIEKSENCTRISRCQAISGCRLRRHWTSSMWRPYGTTSDDKVGITATHGFQCNDDIWPIELLDYIHLEAHTRQTSNIRRALVGNIVVDHSNAVGASPVGAAPTASSFST